MVTKPYTRSKFYSTMVDNNGIVSIDHVTFSLSEIHEFLRGRVIKTRRLQESEEGAPDLISYQEYGDEQYWWIILYVNKIQDPINEFTAGTLIAIPDLSDIEEFKNSKRASTNSASVTLG